jgi:DNA-binding response OmpR family regulator
MATIIGRALLLVPVMRILIVEDEPDTADSLSTLLGLAGFDVQIAGDGHTGLSTAQTKSPDVVLLDIGLPGMDGWKVARQLRQAHFALRPTIIVVSGYGQAEDRKQSHEAGVNFHFVKPLDPDLLLRLLDQLRQQRERSNAKPASGA